MELLEQLQIQQQIIFMIKIKEEQKQESKKDGQLY